MSSSTNTQLAMIDFDQIDSFFNEKLINYDDTTIDDMTNVVPLVFTASNLNIQKSFILPIPVVKGSHITYEFTTKNGDIEFQAEFISNTNELLFSLQRVPSDVETINGKYNANQVGTLVFTFDNNFSWFTNKLLNYKILLYQPQFTVADNARSLHCINLLNLFIKNNNNSSKRLINTQKNLLKLRNEIPKLEEEYSKLVSELKRKKKLYNEAIEISNECKSSIDALNVLKAGLTIRCLDKKLLSFVLQYVGDDAKYVCKYWFLLYNSNNK